MQESGESVDSRQMWNWQGLLTQLQKKENATREFQRLVKRFELAENEYVKAHQQALKKVPTGSTGEGVEEPSMKALWLEYLAAVDAVESQFSTFSRETDTKFFSELTAVGDTVETLRKKLTPLADSVQKFTAENTAMVDKSRLKYQKACRDHDSTEIMLKDAEDAEAGQQKKKPKSAELEKKLAKLKADVVESTDVTEQR